MKTVKIAVIGLDEDNLLHTKIQSTKTNVEIIMRLKDN